MRLKFYLIIFALVSLKSNAGICTAISSADFTLPSTWSCGHTPTGFDQIIIPTGYTVTISTAIDLTVGGPTNTILNISGTLFFSGNASRLDMVETAAIVVNPGGKITTDQNNNSQKINIGTGPSEWTSNDGNLSGPLVITNGNLPIELLNFDGTCVTNGVQLNWSTATEVDNESFLIEKSVNGTEWQFVTRIPGNGTTGSVHHYIHNDYDVNTKDLTYYRLSQIDIDQTTTTFKAIDVNCGNNLPDQMVLFSNPASTELNILLNVNDNSSNNTLKVMNNIGKIVMEAPISLSRGMNTFVFPIDVAPGTYHILLSSDKVILPSQKLMIIK
ncbi:MAG: hypothetical protein K0S53_3232 [Bacteroidetes bacterium]|jgi:hypothetical protein|nr:hypothetical protein [Bacteroidota bacterium]MDF2452487.1 hypothetical protein [Bacteroidota bacterium]